ncbi:uncharacterized protein [Littorina saxatilis]|uniref:uncharacterized protein n=1 Tax=Littorina saxatilis TaxID=31220 RepID=UPI0038B4C207
MGSCSWSGRKFGQTAPYVVKRTDYSISTLIVTRDHRNSIAGTVICEGNQNNVSARCKVRVVYKADRLSNCMASINHTVIDRKDWTVSASCDVEKMFASDGNYTCHWIVRNENGIETQEKGSLSTESFVANTAAYARGTCSIRNLPMPTVTGTYNYDVIVNPGNTRLTGPRLEIGYKISQCGSDGKVDLDETGSAYLTCTGIPDDTVTWYFTRDDGTNVTMGSCSWSNRTCVHSSPPYEVNMTDYSTSTLIVTLDHRKQNHRNTIAGTVICGGNQNSASARCKVRVVCKLLNVLQSP